VKQARAPLRLPEGAFQLVFSGHLEDGQIAIPYGFGKIRLAHLSWRYTEGFDVRRAANEARLAGDVCVVRVLRAAGGDGARAQVSCSQSPRSTSPAASPR
jgi:hypothetical protein